MFCSVMLLAAHGVVYQFDMTCLGGGYSVAAIHLLTVPVAFDATVEVIAASLLPHDLCWVPKKTVFGLFSTKYLVQVRSLYSMDYVFINNNASMCHVIPGNTTNERTVAMIKKNPYVTIGTRYKVQHMSARYSLSFIDEPKKTRQEKKKNSLCA